MKARIRFAMIAAGVALYFAFGWIAGLAVLVVGVRLVARRMVRARHALAPTIPCPWCHGDVPQFGAFTCGNCHARTLGWAWRCHVCSAWAGHLECSTCGMSVSNPLLGPP